MKRRAESGEQRARRWQPLREHADDLLACSGVALMAVALGSVHFSLALGWLGLVCLLAAWLCRS